MLAMSDEDSRKSSSPQRSKSAVSGNVNENKQTSQDKNGNGSNSIKPNMVYIVSNNNYKIVNIIKKKYRCLDFDYIKELCIQ